MTQTSVEDLRPTPTIEDYLAIMYIMQRDDEEIIAARLAESMEVSPPTVNASLKRMERDGWVVLAGPKSIHLSETGQAAARSVIRRHMLTEWMLARMLNVSWWRIHSEAHHIEHTISENTEEQMRANLHDPQTCPHGNPLPGYEYVTADWVALTELPTGATGILRRIHEMAEDSRELMAFLEDHRIMPGVQVTVSESLPFNQTLTILVDNQSVTLGYATARYMFVEIL